MVFRLEQTLDSLLGQIELEETVSEEFVWSGPKFLSHVDCYMPTHLRKSWEEFKTRHPEEFDIMLRRHPGYLLKGYPSFKWHLWYQEIGLPLYETILNAGIHGNKNDPNKKVKITRYYGKRGVVYSIEDEGDGFDIQTIVEKLRRGETYPCVFGGHGIRRLNKTQRVVTANNKGNQIILQYLLAQEPS